MAALDDRLSHVVKSLRKDAVVLRPLILQLDPEWYEAHQSESERFLAANDMTEWAIKTFGSANVLGMSRHKDETNEHLHVLVCPVTDDGRLSQKDWFRSPSALRAMHQDFRQYMADQGYDIAFERKKPGKYARRMSEGEYKDAQELAKRQEAQDARERAQEARERALTAREVELHQREQRPLKRFLRASRPRRRRKRS